ncbi:MAG: DMT family transporter [Moritella sp.]|uniref:DMT family transporter n=1 Tax=Moritella sp. TaxID=78556 RepID=UPI0025CFBB02|nr:DMT family transporter [Moritella sp.]NQZ92264.1 DMT family transporter [Moritella sp.]
MAQSNIKFHLLVVLATTLVAGSFLASANLAGLINPFSLTLLRFAGAVSLLLPFILFTKKWRNKVLRTLPRSMVISLFYSMFFIFQFEALKITTTLNTGTLYTLVPFITALLCVLVFKDKIKAKQLMIYLLGALGTCWVIFAGDLSRLVDFSLNNGDLLFIVGCVSMCCYSISMKRLYRGDELIVMVFSTLLGGCIWMGLALWLSGLPLEWHLIQGESVFYMAYLVIGATLMTVYLYQKTTVALGPTRVMAYIYMNPAVVALLSLLVNGQSINMQVIPGILLSASATFLLQRQANVNKT